MVSVLQKLDLNLHMEDGRMPALRPSFNDVSEDDTTNSKQNTSESKEAGGASQLPNLSTRTAARSNEVDYSAISPIQANPRIAAILRAGLEDRPVSRGDSANIRRPKFSRNPNDRVTLRGMYDDKGTDIWNAARGLPTEVNLKKKMKNPLKSKDKKKDSKKDKADKKDKKRQRKLLKKVKKIRRKHSSIKLQRLFRDRWARMGLIKVAGSTCSVEPRKTHTVASPEEAASAVRIQSVFRGHLARVSAAVIQQAREAGVMVAINGTVQGQSGWYQDFDQQVYFFAVDTDAVWWEVVSQSAWKTYRDVRSDELQPVPILIVKRGTKLGESGKYAPLTIDSYHENPDAKLAFERWLVQGGIFTKKKKR